MNQKLASTTAPLALALLAIVGSSCGRLPPQEARGTADDSNQPAPNPLNNDGSPNTVDIAGVVVTSEDTVVAPNPEAPEKAPEPPAEAPTTTPATNSPQTPETSAAPPPKENPVVPGQGETYVVKPGDTLSTIAEKFGITTSRLAEANQLSDVDRIKPGDKLQIPK